ncbi:MAG: hypothetical protein QOH95_674 [Gaiellaceae bacterium]|nr:hypothetical protein [Gaiellaceae bacterium]
MDERALQELRHLASRDAELSERASELRRLDAEVAAIRVRAEAVDAFLAAYPEEEARRISQLRAAEEDLERRRGELAEAEQALASAAEGEEREHAERALARAADRVVVAQAHVDRSDAAVLELHRDGARYPAELPALHDRAARLHGSRPPRDALSLVEWGSHAHAELFVAAGQVDALRERAIREAHELAAMLLGEPTYGATVAQALARVEAHCASSPGQVSESR